MEEYYKQAYQEPKSQIPDPSFGEIMKDFFFAPFNWSARSTRKEFWVSYAIQFVASIIFGIIELIAILPYSTIDTNNTGWSEPIASATFTLIIVSIIVGLLLLWLKLSLLGMAVRRLHDSDHDGWWVLLYFVPFGWLFILYFMILPTAEKPVKWGSYLFIK